MFEARRFKNRTEAGARLAQQLGVYSGHPDAIVLALPRGGVPVGFAIAKALEIPLDVLLVRKLGVPGNEECAMGAIASGGLCVMQPDILTHFDISMEVVEATVQRKLKELAEREQLYRASRPALQLAGRTAIIVDDGLATGSTMLAALNAAREAKVARLIVAVPVAASEGIRQIEAQADEAVFLMNPEPFYAVGVWYDDFRQTADDEVIGLLDKAAKLQAQRELRDRARHI
ncbi:putative phosphoribosyl transferase [Collimonas sp. PA-H2]|uniref:phosphoribosyltransferase n=1 Tax=Collimonas sp. PA-H2 TaxID=1881062 RepID=UPI000BF3E405|nr:phosphoribosyltransferase [Collimonas sp. PA-H2]PFH09747.1 putative phosphoribosyl transferase [Collimonas sp. PA-H2]